MGQVAEIVRDVWHDGNSHRGRKQKRRLKEAEGLGRKRRIEEAERRELHESDQGLGPGQWTQPGPKGSEDRPNNGRFA